MSDETVRCKIYSDEWHPVTAVDTDFLDLEPSIKGIYNMPIAMYDEYRQALDAFMRACAKVDNWQAGQDAKSKSG